MPSSALAAATATEALDRVTVRFAGDSGDGMQLTGSIFTESTALASHDLSTFPDYPAEIRAPTGTTYGVSAYQINFGAQGVLTAGDAPDLLVVMNPAALMVNVAALKAGATIILDSDAFGTRAIERAGYTTDPRADNSLAPFTVVDLPITSLTQQAAQPLGLSKREAQRCKNVWTLGLVLWMFDRDRAPIIEALRTKFRKAPEIAEANVAVLNAGHAYGETAEIPALRRLPVTRSLPAPGLYRTVTGAEATALGLVAGAELTGLDMFLGTYPITPASPMLHHLARLRDWGVTTFQAEDEIAAVCAAIGASYAGKLGVTTSSGPGIALKTEALGLAISAELPLVVVNAQRGGPSTGLPTKTEQSDLFQAVMGRNGDAPIPVIAARSPSDSFDAAIEAVKIAVRHMTPVFLLIDGYIGNASEPWHLPDMDTYERAPVAFRRPDDGTGAFDRDPESLGRQWTLPGTPGLEYRIGGLEKDFSTGAVSYDSANHQRMTDLRSGKMDAIARALPPQEVCEGPTSGKLAVVAWGSTYGPVHRAVVEANRMGRAVAHIHLRHIAPFAPNLTDLLAGFDTVLVPEMNTGQLALLLQAHTLRKVERLNKVTGQPFKIAEISAAIESALES
ncbi:MAG: 2-oxoglutarate ferredoxin oxidoreductase subunit alpha [Rhodospirillaceae bacterium BRH_c57]|nr:MAG: 2-oxoglutarate ferredoxin oxidoreductase subunit alpha [Rhodospirillaceae bacterium BRH_c57]